MKFQQKMFSKILILAKKKFFAMRFLSYLANFNADFGRKMSKSLNISPIIISVTKVNLGYVALSKTHILIFA